MIVSQNALKHGLLSKETLLPNEDGKVLAKFAKRLYCVLRPEDELEKLLADRIVAAAWRLRRVLRVETEIFQEEMENSSNILSKGRLGIAFVRQGRNSFSNLSRYETAIERSLYRALHELQRIKAIRAGSSSPLPVAVDLDVNLSSPSLQNK